MTRRFIEYLKNAGFYMDKKLYLIDLDNTLIYTDRANNLAYEKAIKDLLKIEGYKLFEELSSISTGRITKQTLAQLLINKDMIQRIVALKNECFENFLFATEGNLILLNELDNLKMQGHLILATNANKRRALEIIDYYKLRNYFEQIICCEGSENKYENVKQRLNQKGVFYNEVFVFDDDDKQLYYAKKIGFKETNFRNFE